MPTHTKSPYATTFKSAIKRGTPAGKAVEAIAKRRNTNPSVIWNSLHKAGLCERQKFNGQWIYWPCEDIKVNQTNAKAAQLDVWQNLIDWCIVSGNVKPQQLANNTGSQQEFMSYCKKFFNRQLSATGTKTRRRTTARKATSRKRSTGSSYYRRAA